ncbi:hypothetical protein V2K29_10500 [Pseudomonas alliivorans]|nr:hypothetical protein [Pseudomonas alliivorans]
MMAWWASRVRDEVAVPILLFPIQQFHGFNMLKKEYAGSMPDLKRFNSACFEVIPVAGAVVQRAVLFASCCPTHSRKWLRGTALLKFLQKISLFLASNATERDFWTPIVRILHSATLQY